MFIFRAWDKEDSLKIRMENREAHLAWLDSLKDRVKLAGPSFNENGQMNGSMLVLDYEDRAELEAELKNDPYTKAGLFAKVQISGFKAVITQF
ncbi:MAG: YciI family protein [Alphaproteobacteria bacterium]